MSTTREEWQTRAGPQGRTRYWIPNPGGRGPIWRRGEETVEEARARALREDAEKVGSLPGEEPLFELPRTEGKKADPKPKGAPKPRKHPKPTSADLEAVLAELLSAPAIPMAALVRCDYCANHFAVEGPHAARQLVTLSEEQPAFRRLLERLYRSWTQITYGAVLAAYIGKPVLHHLAPEELAAIVSPFVGVPPRQPRAPEPAPPFTPPGAAASPPFFGSTRPRPAPHAAPPPPAPGNGAIPDEAA